MTVCLGVLQCSGSSQTVVEQYSHIADNALFTDLGLYRYKVRNVESLRR